MYIFKQIFNWLKIGDVTGGNYSEFEDDGTLVAHGDATTWTDMRVAPFSVPSLGSNPPIPEIVANDGQATFGYAKNFNGTSSYGTVPDYAALDVSDLSIAFWINPDDIANGMELVSRDMSDGFRVYFVNRRINFRFGFGATVSSSRNAVIAGSTSLVVVTAENLGSSTRVRIYVNGVLNEEQTINEVISTGAGGIYVGRQTASIGTGYFYDGRMDDIQLFNVILTQSQIDEMYNAGTGITGLPTGITEATDLVMRFQDSNTNIATLGSGYNMTLTDVSFVDGLIGGASGSLGVALDAFHPGQIMEKFFTMQFPHGKKLNTTIYPHVHFYTEDLTAGNVVWKLEYIWNQPNKKIGLTTIESRTIAVDTTGEDGEPIQMVRNVPENGISAPFGGNEDVSSTLICRLYRDGLDSNDTYPGKVYLHEFDAHFEIDTMGSRQTLIK